MPAMEAAAARLHVLRSHLQGAVDHSSDAPLQSWPCASSVQQLAEPLLRDQVAIVTGSGQGIGAAAAQLFALHGARVVVSDIDAQKADKVVGAITQSGGQAVSVPGDMLDPAFPAELVRRAVEKFGALHILVNNAGFTMDSMIHKMSQEQWGTMLDIHMTAPFRLIQAASKHMREAAKQELEEHETVQSRAIVNVSSCAGLHGNVGQAAYSAAKAGVLGLTRTVAKEWGSFNVRCNTVSFGFIDTRLTQARSAENRVKVGGKEVPLGMADMAGEAAAQMYIPLKRIGSPTDAAGAMLFLASPLANFVNGQCLEVDGGQYI